MIWCFLYAWMSGRASFVSINEVFALALKGQEKEEKWNALQSILISKLPRMHLSPHDELRAGYVKIIDNSKLTFDIFSITIKKKIVKTNRIPTSHQMTWKKLNHLTLPVNPTTDYETLTKKFFKHFVESSSVEYMCQCHVCFYYFAPYFNVKTYRRNFP